MELSFPNSYNSKTKISWQTLTVYNILDNEVANLVDEYKPIGTCEVEWEESNDMSGVYFYQIKTNKFVETKKMFLIIWNIKIKT